MVAIPGGGKMLMLPWRTTPPLQKHPLLPQSDSASYDVGDYGEDGDDDD